MISSAWKLKIVDMEQKGRAQCRLNIIQPEVGRKKGK
jgi:hypothetical protein